MDTIEATKMVMSRIQNIDPQHASKIMGYILIQDQGQNEIIRLAFGPENLLVSLIKQAKAFLDISSNTSSAPSSPSHFPHPQIVIPSNSYHHINPHSPWSFQDPRSSPRADSYASVVNGDGGTDWSTYGGNCGDGDHHLNRRSCSVNDVFIDGGGGGVNDDVSGWWKPCMYCSRGLCKNGTSCKLVHGNGDGNHGGFGDDMCLGSSSPSAIDGFEDFLRIKAIQQQHRIASIAAGRPHPSHFNRCIDFLNERSPSAEALMMGDDIHKFGRFRPDRHDLALASMGLGNSSSRQIYLTFPADSTFKEEDVSNYFSIFGPVQDVRIPYQQKRMFGFVTFILAETVTAILAKGNPHFVCDSRVLVKPYKEKGKIPDKKHHQHQLGRGDFSALESAEPFDHIPFGARMFNHDMVLRKKLELQQAIDFQQRNLMNMQLTTTDQSLVHHNDVNDVSGEEINGSGTQEPLTQEVNDDHDDDDDDDDDDEKNSSGKEGADLNEHQRFFEHILPDNLFASPTNTASADHHI